MTIEEVFQSPDFNKLGMSDKIEILNDMFPQEFGSLPESDKTAIMAQSIGAPVLREQPGPIRRTFGPEGVASPENVGVMGGGTLGSLTPLGPAGGLIGATTGGLIGKASEILFDPGGPIPGTAPRTTPKGKTLLEKAQEISDAGTRGFIAEGGGQLIFRAGSGITKKLLTGKSKKLTSENEELLAIAEELGIPLTSAETKQSAGGALLESFPGRFQLGIQRVIDFVNRRSKAIEKSAMDIGDSISPGTSNDVTTVGEAIQRAAKGKVSGLEKTARRLGESIGDPAESLTVGEGLKTSKDRLLENATQAANRLYDRVKETAVRIEGPDALENLSGENFIKAAQEIAELSKQLSGVKTRPEKIAGSLIPETKAIEIGGVKVDPAELPAQLIEQFKLDEPKYFSFAGLREWQSRLGELVRTTTNRRARGLYKKLFAGVSKDIDFFGESFPPVKPLLDNANAFYKTRVAETFFNQTIRKIDKTEADLLSNLIIRPRGSVLPIQRLRAAVDKESFNNFIASYFDDLVSKSQTNGNFDVNKYLAQIAGHKPEVLRELLGSKFDTLTAITRVFKNSPTDLIKSIGTKEGDKLVNYLARPGGSVEPLQQLKKVVSQETYDQFAAAWLKDLVTRKSIDVKGVFAPDRFLTLVSGKSGFSPAQLQTILGPNKFAELNRLKTVVTRIADTKGIGLNPSETARGILSAGQITGGIVFSGKVIADIAEGDLLDRRTVIQNAAAGLVLLSPVILGKLLYTPTGIKWLTIGLQTPPGSREAAKVASRIAAIIAAPNVGNRPMTGKEFETFQRTTSLRNPSTPFMRITR